MTKNRNTGSRARGRCRPVAFIALTAMLTLFSGLSPAQESDDNSNELAMTGTEAIDPKETISGDATVGVNYFHAGVKFNPNDVWVYFEKQPIGELKIQVTTVDGRYLFRATTPVPTNFKLQGKWKKLNLARTDNKPLRAGFLRQNYKSASEIAVLVTDHGNNVFPVSWNSCKATDVIRIRVNAEGADAYFIRYDHENKKAELHKCDTASENSQFKFDHDCEMRSKDIPMVTIVNPKVQIIRKRGATFEKSISVLISAPSDIGTANKLQDCVEK